MLLHLMEEEPRPGLDVVALDVRRATTPLGFICCCTSCKKSHDTFRVYMLLHFM